jgi:hypothetical protein
MFRLIALFMGAAVFAFGSLCLTNGWAQAFLDLPLAIVVAISMLVGALSMAFHTFIDGVVKDLPEKTAGGSDAKQLRAIEALSSLRQEVIENVMLVLAMLVLYAVLGGSRGLVSARLNADWLRWGLLSFQFSCLVVIVYGAVVQFLGFRVATKLRDILAKNR